MASGQQAWDYKAYAEDRERFEGEVRRYEELAREDPDGYRRKVVRFAAIGYAFIIGLLLLTIALAALAIWMLIARKGGGIQIAIASSIIIFGILRAFLSRWPRPEGFEVKESDAPGLFADIRQMGQELGSPPIHRVVLDRNFNATAAQWPRLGVLGGYENTLTLGLPYLLAVRPNEAKATIAHELGHFTGQHGELSVKTYHISDVLARLRFEWDGRLTGAIVAKFFDWYEPNFNAMAFALRRQQEFEADAAATRLGLAADNARDLLRFQVVSHWMRSNFWPSVWRGTASHAPKDVYTRLEAFFRTPVEPGFLTHHLRNELAEKSDVTDTHPALSDRLSAIGIDLPPLDDLVSDLIQPSEPSAARHFFGDRLGALLVDIGQEWSEEVQEDWDDFQARQQVIEQHLASIGPDAPPLLAARVAAFRALHLLGEVEVRNAAFAEVIRHDPNDPEALYYLALAKISPLAPEAQLAEAEQMLIRAYETNAAWRINIARALFRLVEDRDATKAEHWFRVIEKEDEMLEQIQKHFWNLDPKERFQPLEDDPVLRAELALGLQKVPHLEAAYAAVLPSSRFPGVSTTLVVLVTNKKRQTFKLEQPEEDDAQAMVFEARLPVGTVCLVPIGKNKHLLDKVPHAPFTRIV
ncbi:MAG: M48 family metalloprotease [Fimbriimonas sp.]